MSINIKNKIFFLLFLFFLILLSIFILACGTNKTSKEKKSNIKYTVIFKIYKYNSMQIDNIYEDFGHNYGDEIKIPSVVLGISKAGYKLDGWYEIDNNITFIKHWDFDTNRMPNQDLVLGAKWIINSSEQNKYSVKYIYNNGTNDYYLDTNTYTKGSHVIEPSILATITNKKYGKLLGWYDEDVEDNIDSAWNFELNVMPGHDLTLVALWGMQSYTVTFDFNDSITENIVLKDVYQGSTISVQEKTNAPTKEGYKFIGWFDEDDHANRAWKFGKGGDLVPAHNLKLVANWEIVRHCVIYDFDSPLGVIIDKGDNGLGYTYGSSFPEIDEAKSPVKAGYSFEGWIDQNLSDGKTNGWDFNHDKLPNHDLLLKIKWVKLLFTVTYTDDLGNIVYNDPQRYYFGEHISSYGDYFKEGYKFLGWSDPNLDDGIKYWDYGSNGNTMPNHNLILNAALKKYYSVYYYNNNEVVSSDINKYVEGDKLVSHDPLVEEPNEFDGWIYDDKNKWDFEHDLMPNHDLMLFARWVYKYSVSYFVDNEQIFVDPIYYKEDDIINKQDKHIKEGYKFLGWVDKNNLDVNYYNLIWDFDKFHMPNHNLDLFASYEKLYKVNYQSNGSLIFSDSKYYEPNEKITKYLDLINLKEEGNRLVGWFDGDLNDGHNNVAWDFDTFTMPNHDLKLLAHWVKLYTVTFIDSEAGVRYPAEIDFAQGDKIDIPEYIKKEGYKIQNLYTVDPSYWNYIKSNPSYNPNYENDGNYEGDETNLFNDPISKNAINSIWDIDTMLMPGRSLELYIKWERLYCSVRFIYDFDESREIEYFTLDHVCGKVTQPIIPLRKNYLFNGWYVDKKFNNLFIFDTPVYKNLTLYAKWVSKSFKQVTIKFVAPLFKYDNNGHTTTVDVNMSFSSGILIPDPLFGANGIRYLWYIDKNCSKKFDFDKNVINNNITLYGNSTNLLVYKNCYYYYDISDWEVALCGVVIANAKYANDYILNVPRRINNKFVRQIGLKSYDAGTDYSKKFIIKEDPDTPIMIFPASPFSYKHISGVDMQNTAIYKIVGNSFANCKNLSKVNMPICNYEIGENAFTQQQLYLQAKYDKNDNEIPHLFGNNVYLNQKVDLTKAKIIGPNAFYYAIFNSSVGNVNYVHLDLPVVDYFVDIEAFAGDIWRCENNIQMHMPVYLGKRSLSLDSGGLDFGSDQYNYELLYWETNYNENLNY